MDNHNLVLARFQSALNQRLKTRFGKMLSAQRFSDLFNLNAHSSTTISRETARLWMRGNVMPDYVHLAVLVDWLGLDPAQFLGPDRPSRGDNLIKKATAQHENEYGPCESLMKCFDELDPIGQKTLLLVAEALMKQKESAHSKNAVHVSMEPIPIQKYGHRDKFRSL